MSTNFDVCRITTFRLIYSVLSCVLLCNHSLVRVEISGFISLNHYRLLFTYERLLKRDSSFKTHTALNLLYCDKQREKFPAFIKIFSADSLGGRRRAFPPKGEGSCFPDGLPSISPQWLYLPARKLCFKTKRSNVSLTKYIICAQPRALHCIVTNTRQFVSKRLCIRVTPISWSNCG